MGSSYGGEMTYGEIKKIINPFRRRKLIATGQLSELYKGLRNGTQKGNLSLVIELERKVIELNGKLIDTLMKCQQAEDLQEEVSQLDRELTDIRNKLQQEGYSIDF